MNEKSAWFERWFTEWLSWPSMILATLNLDLRHRKIKIPERQQKGNQCIKRIQAVAQESNTFEWLNSTRHRN